MKEFVPNPCNPGTNGSICTRFGEKVFPFSQLLRT